MVALSCAILMAQPLSAQNSRRISRSSGRGGSMAGLAPNGAEQITSGQYPPQALEDLRTELLNLVDSVQDFGAIAPAELVDTDSLREARGQIQQMSFPQLNALRQGISPSKLHGRLTAARTAVAEYSKGAPGQGKDIASLVRRDSMGFPNATGFCGASTTRIPTGVVLAADVVFFVADGVREFAQDACKQEAVVLGEGGNTSLACIIVDTVWIVAKAVDEGIHFCDDDLTGNIIDTNYQRLDHIHTDLANTDGRVAAVDTHLTTVDNRVAGEFVTLDSKIAVEFNALDTHLGNVDTRIAKEFTDLETRLTALLAGLSTQVTNASAQLVAGQRQIMKLELTPDGQRIIAPPILTCTGTNCPNVLAACPGGSCSWNRAGVLP